jgi:hypothetical protein
MDSRDYVTTTQPAHNHYPGDPNMVGAAPRDEKKGIADKVKGLLGGHGHKTSDAHANHQPGVYGDATASTGTAQSTQVGCLDKLKAKTGVGHGLAPEQTRANRAATGHAMDPVGTGYGHADAPYSPDHNGGMNINSSAAVHGGWPYPTNPNQVGSGSGGLPTNLNQVESGYGGPHPTNPTGVTNPEGGAVIKDHHGNVHEGPRDDSEKKEGFVSKIMDKLHPPRGKHANTPTTTPPTTY